MPPPPEKGAVKLMQMTSTVKAQKLAALVPPKPVVVTFQGSTGDWPFYYAVLKAPMPMGPWTQIITVPATNNGTYVVPLGTVAGTNFFRVGRMGF